MATMIVNDKNEAELWYIDMIAGSGRDKDGVAYFDDLYLDIVLRLDGSIIIDDMDELVEAYAQKDISKREYQLALDTQARLETGCLRDVDGFMAQCLHCLKQIQEKDDIEIDRRLRV